MYIFNVYMYVYWRLAAQFRVNCFACCLAYLQLFCLTFQTCKDLELALQQTREEAEAGAAQHRQSLDELKAQHQQQVADISARLEAEKTAVTELHAKYVLVNPALVTTSDLPTIGASTYMYMNASRVTTHVISQDAGREGGRAADGAQGALEERQARDAAAARE